MTRDGGVGGLGFQEAEGSSLSSPATSHPTRALNCILHLPLRPPEQQSDLDEPPEL